VLSLLPHNHSSRGSEARLGGTTAYPAADFGYLSAELSTGLSKIAAIIRSAELQSGSPL